MSTETVSGDVVDGQGGIYLAIRGEQFEARRVGTSWQMMQFAKAQRAANVTIPKGLPEDSPRRKELEEKRNSAGMDMMRLLLETCMVLLKPHERDRFSEFMDDASMDAQGLGQGELETAIGAVIAAAGGEADKGKADTPIASPYLESPRITPENSRVISQQPVTHEDALPVQAYSTNSR